MSKAELAANPCLDWHFTQDLNHNPILDLGNDLCDSVICCMGVQYLKYPEIVFQEIFRILKPGGNFLISFTSHCFPEKTLTGWLERSFSERIDLMKKLLSNAGFGSLSSIECVPNEDCPEVVCDSVGDSFSDDSFNAISMDTSEQRDPFFGVSGTKPKAKNSSSTPIDSESKNCTEEYKIHLQTKNQYAALCQNAVALGIPSSAISLPNETDTNLSLQEKQEDLELMIASFLSAGI